MSEATFFDESGVARLHGTLSGGGGSSPVSEATASLSAATLHALHTSGGFEFGPTPAAGQIVLPLSAAAVYNFGTQAYTAAATLRLTTVAEEAEYGSSNAWGEIGMNATDAVDSTATLLIPGDTFNDRANMAGQRLAIAAGSNWSAGGDGTVEVVVWYRLLTLP